MSSILIISRDEQITGSLRAELDNRGKYCVVVSSANEALRLENQDIDEILKQRLK